jgi:hypothetical protein
VPVYNQSCKIIGKCPSTSSCKVIYTMFYLFNEMVHSSLAYARKMYCICAFPYSYFNVPNYQGTFKTIQFLIPLQGFVGIVDHAGILVSRQQ